MNWEEKITEGMKLIKEGCINQNNWIDCPKCPFDDYCTILMQNGGATPDRWEFEK